jgi:hypothetical protein
MAKNKESLPAVTKAAALAAKQWKEALKLARQLRHEWEKRFEMTKSLDDLAALRVRHPWPDISELDGDPPHVLFIDFGGHELVTELIEKTRPRIMLEVGTYLGGSTLKWLETRPDFTLIILDSWPAGADDWIDTLIASRPFWVKDIESLKPVSRACHRHGIVKVALHNLRAFRDRVIPIQMPWETGYSYIQSFVEPDIIYIDADKEPEGIVQAHELFPAAILCGDDWTWRDEKGIYRVREPVRRVAALRGGRVLTKDCTWVVDQD